MESDGSARMHSSRRSFLTSLLTVTGAALASSPGEALAMSMKRMLAKAGPEVTLPSGIVYRDVRRSMGTHHRLDPFSSNASPW